jgi:signal transduction histidine kinase
MHPNSPAQTLLAQGIHLRQTQPRALPPVAAQLRLLAGADPRLQLYAELFSAWGELALGEQAAAQFSQQRAQRHLALLKHPDADCRVLCQGLQAALWLRAQRPLDALAPTQEALALPVGSLSGWVRMIELQRQNAALEHLRRYDDALRSHYETVAFARTLNEPAQLANALGSVGGLQSSLMNLVDALPLCDEAWALCQHTDWYGVIHLAGNNRMGVLSIVGRHAEAVAMARQLMSYEAHFPTHQRRVRLCLYAMALAQAQQFNEAQHWLDQAHAEQADIASERAEWVWIQALVHNQQGRPAQALPLVDAFLAQFKQSPSPSEFPLDHAQLHTQAALANEALGRAQQALVHERHAAQARQQAAQQAAHAGRMTLQIAHDLDAAHRARDAALRDSQRAQQEQQRLAELNSALHAANAAKTRFLAAASHDLRQPVQALALYMAALQGERSGPARTELMARMDHSVQALGSLFDVLLDVSRFDAGLVPVHLAPLNLDRLLHRLADEYTLAAERRGLQLRLHLPTSTTLPAVALSDTVLLESCLRNLLGNAIKYTERGGVVLRLRALPLSEHWRVEVRDTGIGIEPSAQALVFQEFFQVDNDARDRRHGLGLGLSIVQRTAALLAHPLCLRSRPGRGSCFSLDLPRTQVQAEAAQPAQQPESSARFCVAVVDDDAAVRDSLVTLLQRWGYPTVQGADAASALADWQRLGQPTLGAAIVDLRLPGGQTGLQAIAQLRQHSHASLPSLVVTGDISADRLRLLAEAGQAWLPKPVMPLGLRSWLQSVARG